MEEAGTAIFCTYLLVVVDLVSGASRFAFIDSFDSPEAIPEAAANLVRSTDALTLYRDVAALLLALLARP